MKRTVYEVWDNVSENVAGVFLASNDKHAKQILEPFFKKAESDGANPFDFSVIRLKDVEILTNSDDFSEGHVIDYVDVDSIKSKVVADNESNS